MPTIKQLAKRKEGFLSGHRLCAGCGEGIVARMVMLAIDKPVIVGNATGCLEVASTIFPYSAWNVPWLHSAFENAAATVSGIEAAYRSLKRQGKIDKDVVFLAFGGDGGTYDIGLQSLSGAAERGHRMLYVCCNNQAYMNCLSTSSLIMTKEGLKKITEIKQGEQVYAFDQKNYQLVLKKCTGVFDNGVKPVYELKTLHHSIKATDNHPFLILQRNGKGKKNNFVWKTLSEVKVGDEVVVLKNINPGKNQYRHKNFLIENKYFEGEKVKSVRLVGEEPTLDLRVEDEHNFIADGIVVHNTGIQRSSATPKAAHTTTSPLGKVIPGKVQFPKDIAGIMVAHNIPYVATSIPGRWNDLVNKVEKAISFDGFTFIDVLTPCRLGWPHEPELTLEISRVAAETCIWPLYEVVEGRYKLTYKPKEKKPVIEWFKMQRRFAHLLKPENKELLDNIQKDVDRRWELLLKKTEG